MSSHDVLQQKKCRLSGSSEEIVSEPVSSTGAQVQPEGLANLEYCRGFQRTPAGLLSLLSVHRRYGDDTKPEIKHAKVFQDHHIESVRSK